MSDSRRVLLCGFSFFYGELIHTEKYLILCLSMTHAQRSQRLLEKNGIVSGLIKAPLTLTQSGCGYALSLRRHVPEALRLLKAAGMLKGKVFGYADGMWSEAGDDLS